MPSVGVLVVVGVCAGVGVATKVAVAVPVGGEPTANRLVTVAPAAPVPPGPV